MVMRLDVRRSTALTALIQTLATVPNEVAKQVRKQSQSVIIPEFKKGLAERAPARVFFDRLVNPSTASVTDRGVKLIGGSGRKNMFPRETEFGAYREEYNTYSTRRGQVTRRTQRQFWHYKKTGWVFYPTVVNMIPRIASLWAQTALRTIHESVEKAVK